MNLEAEDKAPKCASPPSAASPGDDDVVLGRGKRAYNHEGNVRFRKLILDKVPAYIKSEGNRKERRAITQEIIDTITARGGKFLRPVQREETTRWETTPGQLVFAKVKQSLRDMASGLLHAKPQAREGKDSTKHRVEAFQEPAAASTESAVTSQVCGEPITQRNSHDHTLQHHITGSAWEERYAPDHLPLAASLQESSHMRNTANPTNSPIILQLLEHLRGLDQRNQVTQQLMNHQRMVQAQELLDHQIMAQLTTSIVQQQSLQTPIMNLLLNSGTNFGSIHTPASAFPMLQLQHQLLNNPGIAQSLFATPGQSGPPAEHVTSALLPFPDGAIEQARPRSPSTGRITTETLSIPDGAVSDTAPVCANAAQPSNPSVLLIPEGTKSSSGATTAVANEEEPSNPHT